MSTSSSSSTPAKSSIIMRSALMSTFPWFTDFLTNKDGELEKQGIYKILFQNLTKFEVSVETTKGHDADDTKTALVLVEGQGDMPKIILNRPTSKRVVELISLYRLVDILHALRGHGALAGSNPRYSRLPLATPNEERDWPMNRWIDALRNARSSMKKLQAMSADPDPLKPLQARLLGDLHHISGQYDGTKILFNVQMAAIGLYFMLQGCRASGDLALPGFPSDIAQVANISDLPEDQYNYMKQLMVQYDAYKRRYPVSVALLVSPVCLLVNKKLMSRVMSQENLLKASKILGNCKPAILLSAELKLWQALLAVATGEKTAVSAISEFLETDVPWDELQNVSDADRDFFVADPNLPGLKGFQLLTLENETQVNENWPLAYLRPRSVTVVNADRTEQSTQQPDDEPEPNVQVNSAGQDLPQLGSKTPEQTSTDDEDSEPMDLDDPEQDLPQRRGAETPSSHDQPSHASESESEAPVRRRLQPVRRPASTPATFSTQTKSRKGKGKRKQAEEVVTMVSGTGTSLNPFQIDEFLMERDLTFELRDAQSRVHGSKVQFFGPFGIGTEWEPTFHFERDLQAFTRFAKYVENFYVDGQPRHIASPNKSHIAVIESKVYEAMSVLEVQTLLRNKHILVTGCPTEGVQFNAQGLCTLANLEAPIDIQDQSIDVPDGDYAAQMRTGTLLQMLDATRSPTGPILNALSFPRPLKGAVRSGMSSEVEAWEVTAGKAFCPGTLLYPMGEMRWGLAATAGGRHWIHVDSDGLGTYIDVQCGGKWWIIFCPPDGQTKYAFSEILTFLNSFDTNAELGGRWELRTGEQEQFPWVAEAVYLTPGTRFIMRPNTPHAVFTIDHCIIQGGHFYSTTNLQDTFFGIVHCLMGNNLITNTSHHPTRYLLMRMMQYVYKCFVTGAAIGEWNSGHLPNLLDINSMIDVLTLCNYCILSNVLDFRTYGFPGVGETDTPSPRDRSQRDLWDRNALSQVDRQYFIYVRGLAINFIRWLSCNYDATSSQAMSPIPSFEKDFCGNYILNQACAILNYKKQAEAERLATIPWCKFKDIERQLQYVLSGGDDDEEEPLFGDWLARKEGYQNYSSLSFGDTSYIISRKETPRQFTEIPPESLGVTLADKKFRTGYAKGFPSSKPMHVSDQDSGSSESEEEPSSDEEFPPQKRKRV